MKITNKMIINKLIELKKELIKEYKTIKNKKIKKAYKIAYKTIKNDIRSLNKNLIDLNCILYNLKALRTYLIEYSLLNDNIYYLFMDLNNYIVLYYKQYENLV